MFLLKYPKQFIKAMYQRKNSVIQFETAAPAKETVENQSALTNAL